MNTSQAPVASMQQMEEKKASAEVEIKVWSTEELDKLFSKKAYDFMAMRLEQNILMEEPNTMKEIESLNMTKEEMLKATLKGMQNEDKSFEDYLKKKNLGIVLYYRDGNYDIYGKMSYNDKEKALESAAIDAKYERIREAINKKPKQLTSALMWWPVNFEEWTDYLPVEQSRVNEKIRNFFPKVSSELIKMYTDNLISEPLKANES